MTDYKNLKLIASSSPHIRSKDNTRSIMLDVIIALLPALVMSIYVFGVRALTMVLVSVAACVFWEWAYRKLLKKPQSIGDLSAVVTGILLAFVCPPTTPVWMLIIGGFFSIVVVKQLYGGIGCNFVNPALVGRAMLLASYASAMTHWVGFGSKLPLVGSTADVVTSSTPMAVMKGIFSAETAEDALAAVNDLTSTFSISDMFIGRIGGSLGETSALALLLGFVYLLLRRVINWQIPVCYIGTVAVLTLISAPAGMSAVDFMLYNVFGGGLMLGAIFMATDYATSPVTKLGQAIFGVGCGLITCFIRRFGSYPGGCVLLHPHYELHRLARWISHIRPRTHGYVVPSKPKRQEGGGCKMKISGKFILKVAGTLTIISLVVALLLGLVNGVTADKIAAIERRRYSDGSGGRHRGRQYIRRRSPPFLRRSWTPPRKWAVRWRRCTRSPSTASLPATL